MMRQTRKFEPVRAGRLSVPPDVLAPPGCFGRIMAALNLLAAAETDLQTV